MKFFHLKWSTYLLAAFLIITAFSGCGKDDDNPLKPGENQIPTVGSGSITLNGGGYNNKKIDFAAALADYYVLESQTWLVLSGSTDSITTTLYFNGKEAGTYNLSVDSNDESINGIYVIIGSSKVYRSASTGSIKVTQYGNVGGSIVGTFEGTLYELGETTPITISGSFTALRGDDSE